jgi:teichuronic acid biosynthesis glycosyltransferase TuaH
MTTPTTTNATGTTSGPTEPHGGSLVVCSLEPWGEVRRRLHILVDEMVDLDPSLHVLYVDPPVDMVHELRRGSIASGAGPPHPRHHPRVHVLRPRKWLPRVLGGFADRSLQRQVLDTVGELGLHHPLLWVNDASYAPFIVTTGWPSLYDITDDWLESSLAPRQLERLEENERLLLARAGAVVVCSPDLARTRGASRSVEIIPNGVDVDLFRTPQPRPAALPGAPVALYVGTLHTDRVDVPLIRSLAEARPDLQVVLAGPNSLPAEETATLERAANIHLLGAWPYEQVPALLQHADIVIIPHVVNRFTESLDPIKAYECLAVGRPTVATPVAGFRQLGPPVVVATPERFVEAAGAALATATPPGRPGSVPDSPVASWRSRAEAMAALMSKVRDGSVTA